MALHREKVLILAKTYPSPSSGYMETSCVAGINADGMMRRIFPVPFRFLSDDRQFSKWQWIEANLEKARSDHRPESYRIDVGTLACMEKVSTANGWAARFGWIERIPSFTSFSALAAWSASTKGSLALLRPKEVLGLEITAARRSEWTPEEVTKLTRSQTQGTLLTASETRHEVKMLNKLP